MPRDARRSLLPDHVFSKPVPIALSRNFYSTWKNGNAASSSIGWFQDCVPID
jgi:hypothetical protein